ncbi:unnamed protein product [Amoebophrya sp. A120]|nr:unnamed protein product [Amoebophrya sp. A120]|eukprot:GSA120T00024696001.1
MSRRLSRTPVLVLLLALTGLSETVLPVEAASGVPPSGLLSRCLGCWRPKARVPFVEAENGRDHLIMNQESSTRYGGKTRAVELARPKAAATGRTVRPGRKSQKSTFSAQPDLQNHTLEARWNPPLPAQRRTSKRPARNSKSKGMKRDSRMKSLHRLPPIAENFLESDSENENDADGTTSEIV